MPLPCCVTLGELLHLSELRYANQEKEDNYIIYTP